MLSPSARLRAFARCRGLPRSAVCRRDLRVVAGGDRVHFSRRAFLAFGAGVLVECPSQIGTGRSVVAAGSSPSEGTHGYCSSSGYGPLVPQTTRDPLALRLARVFHSARFADLPAGAVTHAKMILASTLASAASGTKIESARIVRNLAVEQGGAAQASVWFDTARLPLASACGSTRCGAMRRRPTTAISATWRIRAPWSAPWDWASENGSTPAPPTCWRRWPSATKPRAASATWCAADGRASTHRSSSPSAARWRRPGCWG